MTRRAPGASRASPRKDGRAGSSRARRLVCRQVKSKSLSDAISPRASAGESQLISRKSWSLQPGNCCGSVIDRPVLFESLCPARRASRGSGGEPANSSLGPFQPPPQRTPSPVLGSSDQSSPQGMAFDVPADQRKVAVILAGKIPETAPTQMPLAAGPIGGVHADRRRARNPAQEVAHPAVFRRPQHKCQWLGITW